MLFRIFSILQVYWVLQGLYYFLLILKSVISGKYWNKAQHLSAVDQSVRWWQFRKRITLFYVVGFLTTVYLIFATLKSCIGWKACHWILSLRLYLTEPSQPYVDATSCLVGCLIYLCHVTCRLYQCTFISIHSWRQVLGPLWIFIVYINQVLSALSLVAEGPKFDGTSDCFSIWNLRIQHMLALSLYVLAGYIQFKTFAYLTSLRKNKAGHVVTTSYKLPKTGIFEELNVSSPHYFAEILAHLAVLVAMGANAHTWMALTYHVSCHMSYLAYVTHQYYLEKFSDDYPKLRNILVPFLF